MNNWVAGILITERQEIKNKNVHFCITRESQFKKHFSTYWKVPFFFKLPCASYIPFPFPDMWHLPHLWFSRVLLSCYLHFIYNISPQFPRNTHKRPPDPVFVCSEPLYTLGKLLPSIPLIACIFSISAPESFYLYTLHLQAVMGASQTSNSLFFMSLPLIVKGWRRGSAQKTWAAAGYSAKFRFTSSISLLLLI